MHTKTSHHPISGRLMPRSNGRPKGSKNRATLLREQIEAMASGDVSGIKVTPLELLLRLMNEAVDEYTEAKERLDAAERLPFPVDKEGKKALRELRKKVKADRDVAIRCAVAAAPYCHPKLKSVDSTVKQGLIISLVQFGDTPAAGARPAVDRGVRHRPPEQLATPTTSAATVVDDR